jgi:hypothetical protein
MKKDLEDYRVPKQDLALFECWINEDATSGVGAQTWWDHCIKQAKDADIVIVLYTGSAGCGLTGSDIGICHAELEAAMGVAADRVRVIKLPQAPTASDALQRKRDKNFQNYFESLALFGPSAKTGEGVIEKAWKEVQTAIVELVRLGSSSCHLSQASTGQALDWHRLNYGERKKAMEKEMLESLHNHPKAESTSLGVLVRIKSSPVFFKAHAAPASLSEPTAREMVGKPFLADHKLFPELGRPKAGPIHLVACPKNVTENQALNMLGFPDATIVSDSFGIHIADNIQNIQIVLLRDCISPSAIRRQLAAWFEFIERTGEDQYVLDRARRRFKIIKVIMEQAKQ